MFNVRFVVFLLLVSGGVRAMAQQRHETFADRPAKRQEEVQRAQERAARDKEEARQWAQAHGVQTRRDDGARVMELMAIRNGRPVYYATKNVNAAISTAANQVRNTAPYNVDGTGVTVGVWDAGSVLTTHQEFGGRVSNKNGVDSHYHSTHVGGTIGAAGLVANAKGMAPGVHIDSYDWVNDVAEMIGRAADGPGQSTKLYLSNHSYGYLCGWEWNYNTGEWYWYGNGWDSSAVEPGFGQYVNEASAWDGIVYDAPYFLPFKAAGNDRDDNPSPGDTVHNGDYGPAETYSTASHPLGDGKYYYNGYDTILPVSSAKNIMTVGAVNDAVLGSSRYLANATNTTFTSWGPADDGRIKPDIVANGYQLYSCDNTDNSSYFWASGTSMATPNACGSAALLVDYYATLFPGQAMRASTLKGLIIHTADDCGVRPGPDYQYGWGLMNTLAAAALLKDYSTNPTRLREGMLSSSTNQTATYSIYSDGTTPLRATLCWTDPPGEPTFEANSRVPVLVNDLDLKIVGPSGTYYPYKLDYNNPTATATANSANHVDNVEQVYIAAPTAGQYTITVNYTGALEDGVQWYSLLVSGGGGDSDGDGLPNAWESLYFGGATIASPTADPDGDGADNLTEYVAGTNPTNPSSVFKATSFSAPAAGSHAPFIINWTPVAGRIYTVGWSDNLVYSPSTDISGDLPYPAGSYTDNVQRASDQNFYRVEVRLP